MMTMIEDPGQFTADVPEDTLRRVGIDPEERPSKKRPPAVPPVDNAVPQQNCILHYISPSRQIVPSFTILEGLALCQGCVLRAADAAVRYDWIPRDFITQAVTGRWLNDER